jgi:HAD superfamily hydrolase (TIGR01450 family)
MTIDEFSFVDIDQSVLAVVAGINYDFNYRTLCMASLYIQVNNATFIATNGDRVFPSHVPERKCPAGGSIVAAIASQCTEGKQPLYMGKPNTQIFEIIRDEHPHLREKPLSKFLMIGDSLKTDIKFGNSCGIDTLLVLSGNTDLR